MLTIQSATRSRTLEVGVKTVTGKVDPSIPDLMTKAELIIQGVLANRLSVDDAEIQPYHIQHFCRNAEKRDILKYRGIGPASLTALRGGDQPLEVPSDDALIERIDRMLSERPEVKPAYPFAFAIIRRHMATLRGIAADAVSDDEVIAFVKSIPDRELVRFEGVGADVEMVRARIESWPDEPPRQRSWKIRGYGMTKAKKKPKRGRGKTGKR